MPVRPGYCPSCERFIGPLDACPYCDCPSERQAGLRLLRILAVVLAVVGLGLLAFSVHDREPAHLAVTSIRPSMNFARVRIRGTVITAPRSGLARSGEPWYGFTLQDGTNRLRISAFGDTASALIARNSTGGLTTGISVRAEGWLSIRAGQLPALQIRNPAHLQFGEEP
jgi:hypothetical protein